MEPKLQQLSTYAIWQKWAKILQRQLERIAEIYDVHEEGHEASRLKDYIERLKLFIDPVAHAQELARRNYEVKGSVRKLYVLSLISLQQLYREALHFLPQISEDMQRLLNSPCQGNCNGRTASDVFKGPHGTENEGIGSGLPDENGGLPGMLQQLLEKADAGGSGYFEEGLLDGDGSEDGSGEGALHPDRHELARKKSKITATGVQ